MKIQVPQILKKLAESTSFPVYITGGFIRNQLSGLGDTDIDICGPVVATALNLPKNYYIKTVNFRLGTSVIKIDNTEFEYTPFRTEKYNEGGAHTPSAVNFTSDINKDVLRRDFACNSLYYDIKKDELIDLCGGESDCKNKVVRAVNPEFTFSSDGLRLLRLVRIAAETGFRIDGATANAAIKYAHFLSDISPERKRDELNKILLADTKYSVENAHYRALKLMQKLGLIKYVIPQLLEGENTEQNPQYHKYSVLEHCFQTVRFADPSVRLAALFHDIGKPSCMRKFGKMHGHEKVSEYLTNEIMGPFGLRYSNDITEETAALVKNHMYDMDGNTSETKIKIFIAQNYDIIDKLVLLNNADRLGSGIRTPEENHRFLTIRDNMIKDNTPIKVTDLKIDGDKLKELGFCGKDIGDMLNDMLIKCIADPHLNNEEWLTTHAKRNLKTSIQ